MFKFICNQNLDSDQAPEPDLDQERKQERSKLRDHAFVPDSDQDRIQDLEEGYEDDPDHCSRIITAFIFDSEAILYEVRTYQAMRLD